VSILVVGASHRSAPVELLESLALNTGEASKLRAAALDTPYVREVVVLATCNRVEIYAQVERFHGSVEDLTALLVERAGTTSPTRFHHLEALDALPALLGELRAPEPLLVGHSDGASIALIYAGRYPVVGLALLAPHLFVEPLTVASIRETRESYLKGELRERMAKHHDDPDAAFWGWCDMWLDPEFLAWNLEADAAMVSAPTLLIQGREDPYGTLEQLDRIEANLVGPVERLLVEGGHSPHLDAAEEVVSALERFAATLR
jgi:pimeloyl-ACP methyl ester carboxylesterase